MTALQVITATLDTQQQFEEVFPKIIASDTPTATLTDFTDWITANRDDLVDALSRHGAILFRGFPIEDANDFDAAIRAFGMNSFTYKESLSNAVRVNRTPLVFTANEAPPDVSIFLHHEMAQTPLFPSRLFFCCEKAAEQDGETPLCRSDVLLERLTKAEPEFVADCERLGVRYTNTMPDEDNPLYGQGRSWRATMDARTRTDAEARLNKLGYSYAWLEDGSLRATTPTLPAIRELKDGRRVFFNQLIAAFRGWSDAEKSIGFGDGSSMPSSAMNTASAIADELSFNLPWQDGDIALIDNYLVMHGRRPFKGTRRVLASLVADDGTRLAATA